MSELSLTETRIRAGIWEGMLRTAANAPAPEVEVLHDEVPITGASLASLSERPGCWVLRVPIPAECLDDGVQTFVIRDSSSGAVLAHFRVMVGDGATDNLRGEVSLLRAELDLLKAAFRRHCRDTAAGGVE